MDWSKHELHVTENELVTIHELSVPEQSLYKVKFINVTGRLLVTGDWGNWVLCRGFVPSADGYVSDCYWVEKIQMHSEQTGLEFSSEKTRKAIQDGLDGELEDYGYEGEDLEKMKEYYTELLDYVELQEWEYVSFAYNNKPSLIDAEDVPFVKTVKPYLNYIFDAFDEICRRLKIESQLKPE